MLTSCYIVVNCYEEKNVIDYNYNKDYNLFHSEVYIASLWDVVLIDSTAICWIFFDCFSIQQYEYIFFRVRPLHTYLLYYLEQNDDQTKRYPIGWKTFGSSRVENLMHESLILTFYQYICRYIQSMQQVVWSYLESALKKKECSFHHQLPIFNFVRIILGALLLLSIHLDQKSYFELNPTQKSILRNILVDP